MQEKLLAQVQKFSSDLKRYLTIIVILIFGAMYTYLVYSSGKLAQEEPSEVQISEKFQGVARPKIDKAAADKLAELEDQNIEVKTLFDQARNNPFSE